MAAVSVEFLKQDTSAVHDDRTTLTRLYENSVQRTSYTAGMWTYEKPFSFATFLTSLVRVAEAWKNDEMPMSFLKNSLTSLTLSLTFTQASYDRCTAHRQQWQWFSAVRAGWFLLRQHQALTLQQCPQAGLVPSVHTGRLQLHKSEFYNCAIWFYNCTLVDQLHDKICPGNQLQKLQKSIALTLKTRSSATAERQRVSYTRLSRLIHWSCTSLSTASVVQLYNRLAKLVSTLSANKLCDTGPFNLNPAFKVIQGHGHPCWCGRNPERCVVVMCN